MCLASDEADVESFEDRRLASPTSRRAINGSRVRKVGMGAGLLSCVIITRVDFGGREARGLVFGAVAKKTQTQGRRV